MRALTALVIAYLLGSFLPADAFARAKGIDIRSVGTGNPGTTNAWRCLGRGYGIMVGVFDVSKGLVAMLIAWELGLAAAWIYAAGIAAVIGHVYPVWHRFRGGQGIGVSTGLLLYCLTFSIATGRISIAELAALALSAIIVFALYRSATVVGVAVLLPLLAIVVVRGDLLFDAFAALVIGYVWAIQVQLALKDDLFHIADSTRRHLHRLRIRPR